MNPLLLKALPYLAGLALLALFGWWAYGKGEAHIQARWDAEKVVQQQAAIKQLEENQKVLEAHAAQTKQAEVQHETDQAIIDSLHDTLVSVPVTHFPRYSPMSKGGSPSHDSNAVSGVVPTAVDVLFADLQGRVGEIVKRCDDLNAAAIEMNSKTR